jgi:outer membrane lipoprotein-sorting protein
MKCRRLLWVRGLYVSLLICAARAAPAQDLQTVLAKLDKTAQTFRTAQATFTWTTFNSVVNDVAAKQTGTIYFERSGNETKMKADLNPPDAQQVIFTGGKIEIYKQTLGTVDVYPAGAHREEFETFLVLGFGSSGTDMQKSFEVKYDGQEKIGGVDTEKLELTPKAENIRNHFPQIFLWIDSERGVSVRQKLMEANGDYRLAEYSNIQLGQKISDKFFRLRTSGTVTYVNH